MRAPGQMHKARNQRFRKRAADFEDRKPFERFPWWLRLLSSIPLGAWHRIATFLAFLLDREGNVETEARRKWGRLALLGLVRLLQGRQPESVRLFKRALALDPHSGVISGTPSARPRGSSSATRPTRSSPAAPKRPSPPWASAGSPRACSGAM